MKKQDRYIVIMAGGSGERFWPVSRKKTPKQLISLLGDQSFLQQTVTRAKLVAPLENILIITNQAQASSVRKQIPELPAENILAEPCRRDTCAAIALGAAWVGSRNPKAVMSVLPADHFIPDLRAFRQTLVDCSKLAGSQEILMTIGIRPTEPATGYGYIKAGKPLKGEASKTAFCRVDRFVEKPDLPKAKRFLKSGQYHWNAGMFVWSIPALLDAFDTHLPEMASACRSWMTVAANARRLNAALKKDFSNLPRISVDFALMEKASNVVMAEATFGWDDLGSWTALGRHLKADASGNCARADLVEVDAHDNIVFDARTRKGAPITLVGIRECVVVLTDDATLVASKSHDQQIKALVTKLAASERFAHLV